MSDPVAEADAMAPWSDWVPFDQVGTAERLPGVYMARLGPDGLVVYVGCAGPRAGGRTPQGLHGRLGVYASGKGIVSGLGEAAADGRWPTPPGCRSDSPRSTLASPCGPSSGVERPWPGLGSTCDGR